ncbi:hypothetical protein [Saccharopolyspora sp. SCSIO 74807]|uniref:hypothetical protein n=1 Tax=Saccharopolyspora sp. SCSIO 74807 TaxID=3118084 RepID=UPI0030D1A309
MRPRRGVLAVLTCLGAGTLLPVPAVADGDVVVTPGDADGLYGAPSVDLGAVAGGTPSSPGQSGSAPSGRAEAGAGVAGPPLGLSWSAPGSGVPEWFTVAPEFRFPDFSDPAVAPSPDVLAGQAAGQLRLPLPTPRHSPDLRLPDGRAATVVGEHTWFWTEPGAWRPVSRRTQAGPVWVEVTATPRTLSLDPGTGQPASSCTGPGTPYNRSFGLHAASPDCDVVFAHSSAGRPGEQVPARWAITWQVSWRGFDGTAPVGGTLAPMTSRAEAELAVAEAQALTTD